MRYKIVSQSRFENCERDFTLEDKNGRKFLNVDLYTGGELVKSDDLKTNEEYYDFLKSLVGKEVEIDKIYPRAYNITGEAKLI